MVKATDWDSLVRATAFRRPACSAPSRQNCTPLPCRLLSPGHTYCRLLPFPTRPSIPVLAVPSFSDANTMSNRIHPSDAGRGGIGSPAAGVHGLEEVQHGLPGHRRLLRLRRRGQAGVPGRQLLPAAEALRRRALAHGWTGHAAPVPQAAGDYSTISQASSRGSK